MKKKNKQQCINCPKEYDLKHPQKNKFCGHERWVTQDTIFKLNIFLNGPIGNDFGCLSRII
jgi:hypothetical protein